ncbi:hypothetical protein P280DRAFT_479986 [Massarina eburnea CBS 473.64]|uniref:Anaphase-promoting complex subunit 2 n=1 Tax=Massarina eburnea CBS 473.64 TaxID=1395130 RepID=A0A6A6S3E6_9PLEO|nr:hypothetical protein P280DRAFT_479986 [Massarina eburnea CBS 473.64]
MDHATLVFASVFPVPTLSHTTPTPLATPDLGYTAPGSSFGSPFAGTPGAGQQHRSVKRNVAWSTATRFLGLESSGTSGRGGGRRTRDVEEALSYLLVGEGRLHEGNGRSEGGLVEWFTNEVRMHFARVVRPGLRELWGKEVELRTAWDILEETQRILAQVQNLYSQPFSDHIIPFLHQAASNMTIRPGACRDGQVVDMEIINGPKRTFQREIHAAFAHSLPPKRFSKTLSHVLYDAGCRLFRFYIRHDGVQASTTPENSKEVRDRMTALLMGLESVGLGGDKAQKAFAHAMNKIIDTFISSHYVKVDWSSRRSVVADMRNWVENGFCPLVELVLECLRCESTDVDPAQLKQWQEMALNRLGRSRVENLFDFIINWDHSVGAILDLKEYLKLDGAKEHLKNSFSRQVSRRLLHPGATTTYVLNVYISIIRAFHKLEPKGVLLQSVARPIRRYLKERDDTARIIISSLLIDVDDEASSKFASNSELSYEIASEMAKPFAHADATDDEFNWNDMNWQPLPHDASPEYKKSKVEDVIYFLLTLWDREDFINELKNILGDHLLRCQDAEYQKEIRLLELIKVRLGEDKLQACEVMLRDMLESRRINDTIRTATETSKRQDKILRTPEGPTRGLRPRPPTSTPTSAPAAPPAPTLNAQILSSFFWPVLRDDDFHVPAEILALQKDYETRFERIKGMRKLRWMNALGESRITLEFEDRTEEFEHLTPWQVSVVYAFQPQPGEEWAGSTRKGKGKAKTKTPGITRNIEQLEESLEMDEALIRQAIAFWVGKSVLRETAPSTYTVMETLSHSHVDEDAAAAAQELAEVQAQQTSTVKSQADVLNEKRDVYEAFILGMLTNQGNMGVGRILMMMRMMVQGGFPFAEDEVRGMLVQLEERERVVGLGGDVWGVKK